jgi:hypothetical protein
MKSLGEIFDKCNLVIQLFYAFYSFLMPSSNGITDLKVISLNKLLIYTTT